MVLKLNTMLFSSFSFVFLLTNIGVQENAGSRIKYILTTKGTFIVMYMYDTSKKSTN